METTFGWLGNVAVLTGYIALGRRRRWGFMAGAAGNALWIAAGLYRGLPEIYAVNAFFLVAAIVGWINWGRTSNAKST